MAEKLERSILPNPDLEIREKSGKPKIFGYAAVFNKPSDDLGGFVEFIREGAFDNSLQDSPDVSARVQHEGGMTTIGRTTNGSLKLGTDERGLWYEISPPNTTVGRDIIELIRGGFIDKSSFAFTIRPGGAEWDWETAPPTRWLTDLDLVDVAPVDGPAYSTTTAEVRSAHKLTLEQAQSVLEEARKEEVDEDEELRELVKQQYTWLQSNR